MVTACVYVWDGRNLVLKDARTGAESRKPHINVEAVSIDKTVRVVAVQINAYNDELESPVPGSINECSTTVCEPIKKPLTTRIQKLLILWSL